MDPDDKWVGGYVGYEWEHLGPQLANYGIVPEGLRILEFGCNVGASCIVLAAMGGTVTGVDIAAEMVAISEANIALHDMADRARAVHVADTRKLPLSEAGYDLVIANSVLEYVDPQHLDAIMAELHRVTKPGGHILICGTASRLAPREIHSGRWLVNYLPKLFDRIVGRSFQRGLSPRLLARTIKGRFDVVAHDKWLSGRRAVHGRASLAMRLVAGVARLLGIAPGWLSPNIELLLVRR